MPLCRSGLDSPISRPCGPAGFQPGVVAIEVVEDAEARPDESPARTLDITSAISWRCRSYRRKAIKSVASSIILVLRSVMSCVTVGLVRPSPLHLGVDEERGSTPVTSPPAVRTLWARRYIRPLRAAVDGTFPLSRQSSGPVPPPPVSGPGRCPHWPPDRP